MKIKDIRYYNSSKVRFEGIFSQFLLTSTIPSIKELLDNVFKVYKDISETDYPYRLDSYFYAKYGELNINYEVISSIEEVRKYSKLSGVSYTKEEIINHLFRSLGTKISSFYYNKWKVIWDNFEKVVSEGTYNPLEQKEITRNIDRKTNEVVNGSNSTSGSYSDSEENSYKGFGSSDYTKQTKREGSGSNSSSSSTNTTRLESNNKNHDEELEKGRDIASQDLYFKEIEMRRISIQEMIMSDIAKLFASFYQSVEKFSNNSLEIEDYFDNM